MASASPDPHDPGPALAGQRAAEAGDAASRPIRTPRGSEIRVGTASWTDPTMTAPGVFYPPDATTAEERLRYYASRFPVVEVDATYYGLPQEAMSQRWVERTPDDFVFDVKAYALMTGQPTETRRLPKSIREALPEELQGKARLYARDLPPELADEVWAAFRRGIEPLRASGKLGAVFLQFPRWVFPSHDARQHIREARERLRDLPVAVEFRNGSWFNEKNAERTLRFLSENAIPYVIVDEPQGFKSSVPPVAAVTSPDLAVARFHGRRADTWERRGVQPSERFRYLYDEDELAEWAPTFWSVAEQTKETHVLMNNCFSNYGTTNAAELARLLRELQERSPEA
jgi:uncharacterized protein YecE (DUF72 family)